MELQLLCKDLVLDFKGAKFDTTVSTSQQYDEHTNFTEGNITTYLAELEEYISGLIHHTAHKKGDPNASVSTIPFNKLTNKDWHARDMAIEPAFDVTVETSAATGEDEEGSTDTNVLYRRFQEKVERNLITGNRKPVKGNQQDPNQQARDD